MKYQTDQIASAIDAGNSNVKSQMVQRAKTTATNMNYSKKFWFSVIAVKENCKIIHTAPNFNRIEVTTWQVILLPICGNVSLLALLFLNSILLKNSGWPGFLLQQTKVFSYSLIPADSPTAFSIREYHSPMCVCSTISLPDFRYRIGLRTPKTARSAKLGFQPPGKKDYIEKLTVWK